MIRLAAAFLIAVAAAGPVAAAPDDGARWRAQAARVTIVRDRWGIAHVSGPTDADAVFGMMYAQAEDDFNRIETNYLNAMGRLAEAEGESAIWRDLRMKLFVDPAALRAQYAASPAWLQALMTAWADGLNYYLSVHPEVVPRVIRRFEPWMALSFTEGSIGGDIESVSLRELAAFYGTTAVAADNSGYREPRGSNGFAIAPANTVAGRALLLINPHTSFYFRSEAQVTSGEGLNVYGAATWGQFFVYQGFNARAGWMHTTSGVDNVDEFADTVARRGGGFAYRFGTGWRPLTTGTIVVPYRAADGRMASRSFTVYRDHRGPIVRRHDGKWISVALMQKPVAALEQSFLRTKATDYASFVKVAALQANSSNDTIFADAKGEIAYLHPQFVPVRDNRFDYTRPVDGSDPATDWRGLHALDTLPRVSSPAAGWIANSNNAPWFAAGADSPKAADFARYMDSAGQNPRGESYARLLPGRKDFTPAALIAAAYDPYLPAFARLIPRLVAAYDRAPRPALAGPVAALRTWDYRWSTASVPTSLAVYWGEAMGRRLTGTADDAGADDAARLDALAAAVDRLTRDFGTWRTPWGAINRFQRLTANIEQRYDDARPSFPVGFTSARWGSLASFGAEARAGTKRRYGDTGNSFVAVVEFGPQVRAWAVTAGGASGDPASPHFADQSERYAAGSLREVVFTPAQLTANTERRYHPG